MNLSTLFKSLATITLSLIVAAMSVFVSPASFAYAQQGTPVPRGTPERPLIERIDKALFARAQKMLKDQSQALERANKAITKTQEWLDELKGKGKDVANLDAALVKFKSQIAEAQAAHDLAQKTLDAHAGFDNNGAVTDREKAKDTVLIVTKSSREATVTLIKATNEFQKTVRDLLKKYRVAPTPKA